MKYELPGRSGLRVSELSLVAMEGFLNSMGTHPAEHDVGHVYRASPELERFCRRLDPANQLT